MKILKLLCCINIVSLFLISEVNASQESKSLVNAKARGLEIAKEVDLRDRGWGDSVSELRMELRHNKGKVSERRMRISNLEVEGDGDKSLTIFKEPKDVTGTAFLSYSHTLEPDQQWLYLPALKRVKRIASANKSGPFLGSEFAFEDITSFEVDRFEYELLREEVVDGLAMYVVKFVPKYKYSGYTYQERWIDKTEYRIQKVVFYDRKKSLLKTLQYGDYKKYLGKFWRAGEYAVTNHQTGKATVLYWESYEFGVGLTEKDFNHNTLKRSR